MLYRLGFWFFGGRTCRQSGAAPSSPSFLLLADGASLLLLSDSTSKLKRP